MINFLRGKNKNITDIECTICGISVSVEGSAQVRTFLRDHYYCNLASLANALGELVKKKSK